MTLPKVWSERGELHATGWKDCVYSSGLMALIYGGFTDFPLGIYTDQEREALERSDDQPDETWSTDDILAVAVKRRYGLTLRPLDIELDPALDRVGTALVLIGVNGRLAAGHTLRRWDPDFIGGHAVTVIPKGAGKVLWLDPEAPMGYAGDITDTATVLRWASGRASARVVREGEYEETAMLPIYDAAPRDQLVDLAIGTPLLRLDGKTPLTPVKSGGVGVQSPFATSSTQRLVRISVAGVVQAAIVATAACGHMRPRLPDCEALVVAASEPLKARLAAIKTAGGW